MDFVEILNYIMVQGPSIIDSILVVVGGAALLATITPTPKDDATVGVVKKVLLSAKSVLNILGANFGKARNIADATKADAEKLAVKFQIKD